MDSERRECPGTGALIALSLTPLLAGLALLTMALGTQDIAIMFRSVFATIVIAGAVVMASPFVALRLCRANHYKPTKNGLAAWCITWSAGTFVLLALLTVW